MTMEESSGIQKTKESQTLVDVGFTPSRVSRNDTTLWQIPSVLGTRSAKIMLDVYRVTM